MTNLNTSESDIAPSNIELALKQLSLREPSKALDSKVAACFKEVRVEDLVGVPTAGWNRRSFGKAWKLVSLVAAVCLLLGVVVGRLSVPVGTVDHVAAMENGSASISAEDKPSRAGGGFGEAGSGQNPVINVNDIPEVVLREHFPAPAVAMFCALGTGANSGNSYDRCLACHQGLSDAKAEFRRLHSSMLNSEVCTTCHVSARDKPVNVFTDEVSIRPWQTSDSPTG
ncbi:MAG: hypothetical protein WAO83_08360 [Fuerstiella sp.]